MNLILYLCLQEDDEEVRESDEDGSDSGSESKCCLRSTFVIVRPSSHLHAAFTIGPDFMGFPLLRNLNGNGGSDNDDDDGDLDDEDGDGDGDGDGDLLSSDEDIDVDDDDGDEDNDEDVFDYFDIADSSSDGN